MNSTDIPMGVVLLVLSAGEGKDDGKAGSKATGGAREEGMVAGTTWTAQLNAMRASAPDQVGFLMSRALWYGWRQSGTTGRQQ